MIKFGKVDTGTLKAKAVSLFNKRLIILLHRNSSTTDATIKTLFDLSFVTSGWLFGLKANWYEKPMRFHNKTKTKIVSYRFREEGFVFGKLVVVWTYENQKKEAEKQ